MVYSQTCVNHSLRAMTTCQQNQFKSPSQLNLPQNLLHILDQPLKKRPLFGVPKESLTGLPNKYWSILKNTSTFSYFLTLTCLLINFLNSNFVSARFV